jgi:hypothetical protein
MEGENPVHVVSISRTEGFLRVVHFGHGVQNGR